MQKDNRSIELGHPGHFGSMDRPARIDKSELRALTDKSYLEKLLFLM
ncbi:MAG: hypothetical protein KDN05_01715 [Verrucomicrobiae bacterium]|nr:hypothetical protein [Verrucomicrobiae bacterium]